MTSKWPILFLLLISLSHPFVCLFVMQSTQQFLAPSSYYQGVQGGEGVQAGSSADTSQQVSQYAGQAGSAELHQPAEASLPGQTSQTSIADMLAAASDRVVERLGYEYSEAMDMYYCGSSGLYYDQVSCWARSEAIC